MNKNTFKFSSPLKLNSQLKGRGVKAFGNPQVEEVDSYVMDALPNGERDRFLTLYLAGNMEIIENIDLLDDDEEFEF